MSDDSFVRGVIGAPIAVAAMVGGVQFMDKTPEYVKTAEQVAADKVVGLPGSKNLSHAEAQKALIDAKAEEIMKREGIKKVIDGKNNGIFFGSVGGGAVAGMATGGYATNLLEKRKRRKEQEKTGAAEIS